MFVHYLVLHRLTHTHTPAKPVGLVVPVGLVRERTLAFHCLRAKKLRTALARTRIFTKCARACTKIHREHAVPPCTAQTNRPTEREGCSVYVSEYTLASSRSMYMLLHPCSKSPRMCDAPPPHLSLMLPGSGHGYRWCDHQSADAPTHHHATTKTECSRHGGGIALRINRGM